MCVLWKIFNTCMWMLKGIYAQNRLCLSMCACCIAVGSLWWNRRSLHDGQCGRTSGFTVKNNNEPRTLPKQGFRDVWVCERECMWKFLHIVVKVHSIQSQTIVLLTIIPLYHLSNALGWCQLKWAQWRIVLWFVVPFAGINLLSAPSTQQGLQVTFGLDLEPKLMF